MSRIDPFQLTADQIYHEMTGKSDGLNVQIAPYTSYAATLPDKNTLLLHPLTLLKPEDLPEDLQVKGPDDPKLKSSMYFKQLKSWLAKTFEIDPDKLHNLREIFDLHLRTWQKPHLIDQIRTWQNLIDRIRTWQKPHLIDRIKRFAIAHEIGHIFHLHNCGNWDRFFSFTLSLVMTVLLLELFPFYLAVALSIIVIDVSKRVFKALREYSEQYQEREADMTAIRYTRDLPAAKSFFTAIDTSYKHRWDKASWFDKLLQVLFQPESLFHISHPSPQERIQNIQNALKKI